MRFLKILITLATIPALTACATFKAAGDSRDNEMERIERHHLYFRDGAPR